MFKQIVIIPRAHCSGAQSDFKALCAVAKLHPMLSEMYFSILLTRWVFLSLQSPVGSRQGLPGASGRVAPAGHGRGRAARPGPSEVPRKALPGGARLAGNNPATSPPPQPLSSFPRPLQPTPLHHLLSSLPGASEKRAHRCVRRGCVVKASPTNTLSACAPLPARLRLPVRLSQLQEATIKPMSIMSPVHFRKGRF